ncbi:MAG: 4-(cytidine 5'-diphospho)-2-C-methyl-D-erythritol kinase [Clostridia bacterium]|nr:4-(cytidine 5'-diphospho)-2-C-methyl-D-erythritol kinase [Clostridia bacterium]
MITEKAYAKINLYLDVLGKREDGYHNIVSVMTEVRSESFCDTVTVKKAAGRSMTCTDPTLTTGEDNLCLKAANAFFCALGSGDGCLIELEKHLPREAGLGGGSSDAAAVLRALNRLYDGVFATDELCKIGAKIGADVPFCVVGGTMLAEGIGEILSPFPSLPECRIVISGGVGKVSTPEAYRIIDNTPPTLRGNLSSLRETMENGDLREIGKHLYNRFEDTLPSCQEVKKVFTEKGALGTLMSGSGSAVFGLFDTENGAKSAQYGLINAGFSAFLA